MKHIALSFLIALLIYGCANEEVKTVQADTIKPYNVDSIKQAFLPIINGTWIADEYYQAIAKTKSPYKAYEKAGFYTGLVVEEENWQDSLYISVNLGNHEGSSFATYYKPGHTLNALPTNVNDYEGKAAFCELGYEINNKDTFLFLYLYNNANTLYDRIKFRRVVPGNPGDELGFGVEWTVNKLLFAGDYIYTDKFGPVDTVTFTLDGSVRNFGMSLYDVFTDFADAGYPGDRISFGTEGDAATYNFRIDGDTLNVYGLGMDEKDKWFRGDLEYKFIRITN